MKLVLDEKIKHRLIGLAVIISLGVIFAPALMKKSPKSLDKNLSLRVALPPKPSMPKVAVTDEQELFKTIKIAKVRIPSMPEEKTGQEKLKVESIQLAQNETGKHKLIKKLGAENSLTSTSLPIALVLHDSATSSAKKSIKSKIAINRSPATLKPVLALKQKQIAKNKTIFSNKTSLRLIKKQGDITNTKAGYAVQLASFTQLYNAQKLVNKLRNKGYAAHYSKISNKQGTAYKVYAGDSSHKQEALKLKTQLANAMQLQGFVVSTGVS